LRIDAVLGLGEQVGGDEVGARAVVGDHQDFGDAGRQVGGGARGVAATSNFAAVTQALPGPKILSHFGMLAVP
jgi:hypothetical protein